ncbi:cell division inhibitor SepF [Caloramator fervidus]|uniref:Cell division protein SepF n=1 Tax=Caloramator fervidus TaxID=29344 RepID=A0A1H5U2Y8_9CLOT|nr:cell division protein SepF [Caloramator fervidus]SEF68647.1 cell division inhibitor SepF [Caloramator fervidus]
MTNKILKPFNKMMDALGFSSEEQEDAEEREQEQERVVTNTQSKIVSIKTMFPKVILKRPQQLNDTTDIIEAIKSKKIVILNMINLDQALAQRILDIILGAAYALEGKVEEVAKSVYLVVPEAVEITNELKEQLDKGTFIDFD